MKFASLFITSCLSALVFLVSPLAISAQETSSTSTSVSTSTSSTGEEFLALEQLAQGVVLTANRTADDARSVAALVSIIDSDDIANSLASTIVELLAELAGVSVTSTSSPAQAQVSLRGFGENGFGRTLVLVDGVPLNSADMRGLDWLSVPLARIERIEVVRGAASSLYGNNAIGGVINIITKRATKDLSTDISLSAGSNWSHQESAHISFYKDLVGLNLVAENTGTQGWRQRSGFRSSRGGADLVLELDPSLDLRLSASVSDTAFEMPGAIDQDTFLLDPRTALNYDESGTQRSLDSKAFLTWKASDVFSFNLPVSWSYGESSEEHPAWPLFLARQTQTFDARPQASFTLGSDQVQARINTGLDLRLAGIENQGYSDLQRTLLNRSYTVFQRTLGLYLNADLTIDKVFSLAARIREDLVWHGKDTANGTSQALVYGFSLLAKPIEEIKFFARYDSLFRYPFLDERYSLLSSTVWDLRPETGFNLEAGASLYFSEVLSLDFSGYLLDLVDEIAFVSDFGPDFGSNQNIGTTRRLGIDSQLNLKPIKELELAAGYSFVDARFVGGANDGKMIPLVPSHKLSGKVTLKLPFGLSLAPKVSYVSDYYAGGDVSNGATVLKERLLLDLQARLDLELGTGNVAIVLEAKNLLDTSYASQSYLDFMGNPSYYPGDGRSLAVSVSYRY